MLSLLKNVFALLLFFLAGIGANRLYKALTYEPPSASCASRYHIKLSGQNDQCGAKTAEALALLGMAEGQRSSSPSKREISKAMALVNAHCPAGTASVSTVCGGE